MADIDTAKARELLAAATDLPWRCDDEHGAMREVYPDVSPAWCVSATKDGGEWFYDLAYMASDQEPEAPNDAELIVWAVNNLPALLDEIDRLTEQGEAVQERVEFLADQQRRWSEKAAAFKSERDQARREVAEQPERIAREIEATIGIRAGHWAAALARSAGTPQAAPVADHG